MNNISFYDPVDRYIEAEKLNKETYDDLIQKLDPIQKYQNERRAATSTKRKIFLSCKIYFEKLKELVFHKSERNCESALRIVKKWKEVLEKPANDNDTLRIGIKKLDRTLVIVDVILRKNNQNKEARLLRTQLDKIIIDQERALPRPKGELSHHEVNRVNHQIKTLISCLDNYSVKFDNLNELKSALLWSNFERMQETLEQLKTQMDKIPRSRNVLPEIYMVISNLENALLPLKKTAGKDTS